MSIEFLVNDVKVKLASPNRHSNALTQTRQAQFDCSTNSVISSELSPQECTVQSALQSDVAIAKYTSDELSSNAWAEITDGSARCSLDHTALHVVIAHIICLLARSHGHSMMEADHAEKALVRTDCLLRTNTLAEGGLYVYSGSALVGSAISIDPPVE
ncbi:hypothetical protein X801_02233, partial [Opisthorchis viverrini]